MYVLPDHPNTICPCVKELYVFSADGLKISCDSPMRRWRVMYVGGLKRAGSTDEDLVYVRISFIWHSLSAVHDLKTEFLPSALATAIASAGLNTMRDEDLALFERKQNRYEQWGQLMGTITFGDKPPEEFYLWSPRTRIHDYPLDCDCEGETMCAKVYLYFKNGQIVKLEKTSIENFISNYVNGYTISPACGKTDVKKCSLDVQELMDDDFSSTDICFETNIKQTVAVTRRDSSAKLIVGAFQETTITVIPVTAQFNGEEGYGAIHIYTKTKEEDKISDETPYAVLMKEKCYSGNDFTIPLDDERCQSVLVSGGKGCCLAALNQLSKTIDDFVVPNGFVITTAAFNAHIRENEAIATSIGKIAAAFARAPNEQLDDLCQKCEEAFSSSELSALLKSAIVNQLRATFGDDWPNLKFAVRSSAIGEDSMELSWAGQMSTSLGVTGLDEIFKAVIKCWASRMSVTSVSYAKWNNQPCSAPVAVVVQAMVAADAAGVFFSADPITGNPTYPQINANFGLGESVVSATATPDIFVLEKRPSSLTIHTKTVGEKKICIKLNDAGVTQEISESNSETQCAADELILEIGRLALQVSKCFRMACDIEWCVVGEEIYFLQIRHITSLHKPTDLELVHELDTPVSSSYEYYTKANTGEVFLGCSTPLSLSLIICGLDINTMRNEHKMFSPANSQYIPYRLHTLSASYQQIAINLTATIFRHCENEVSLLQRAFQVALFGRPIDDELIHMAGVRKYGYVSALQSMKCLTSLLVSALSFYFKIGSVSKEIHEVNVDVDSLQTVISAFETICDLMNLYFQAASMHQSATQLSSLYNVLVLLALSENGQDWENTQYSDFAKLLSGCSNIESADIPLQLEALAEAIKESSITNFPAYTAENAVLLLQEDTGEPGKLFKEFLEKHGHRCVKEFDVKSSSWELNPNDVVSLVQKMVQSDVQSSTRIEDVSISSLIKEVNTPLTKSKKFTLRLILPLCRAAVAHREQTKSLMIRVINWLRKVIHQLGHLLVRDGHLPSTDLVFYLTVEEIKAITDSRKGRNYAAIAAARKKLELNNLVFPEIFLGAVKPVLRENPNLFMGSSYTLKGTPVTSAGIITARAHVAMSLEEAYKVQNGEILVVEATDIAWSTIFPILSGLVTVLGGLISHGAVVAREYGLPCIVGVKNATAIIQSGDLIALDTTQGTVSNVDEYESAAEELE